MNNWQPSVPMRKIPIKFILVFGDDSDVMLEYCQKFAFSGSFISCFPFSDQHPSRQAEYMDRLVLLKRERARKHLNKQYLKPLVILTHSEAMLTRLQTRIAERIIKKEEVLLLRVTSAKRATTLKLNNEGDVLNWPKNFFGDTFGESCARALAALKNKRKK